MAVVVMRVVIVGRRMGVAMAMIVVMLDRVARGIAGMRAKKRKSIAFHDKMVGERGFEPPAPASRRQCSTRLSYSPTECGARR